MTIPFTAEEFFAVFASYNDAVWPMQIVLYGVAAGMLGLCARPLPRSDRLISLGLAFLWAWMAIAYHYLQFTRINPAAYLFGLMFLMQAAFFLRSGVILDRLRFRIRADLATGVAALLVLYALVVYPLLGRYLGHDPAVQPTLGLPCPSTIFTLGLMFLLRPPFPRYVVLIPVLWAAIGTVAALRLSVPEDLGLMVAGVLGITLLWRRSTRLAAA